MPAVPAYFIAAWQLNDIALKISNTYHDEHPKSDADTNIQVE